MLLEVLNTPLQFFKKHCYFNENRCYVPFFPDKITSENILIDIPRKSNGDITIQNPDMKRVLNFRLMYRS